MVRVCVWFFPMLLYYHNNSCNKPFVSTKWHQKELLGCVVYSHCLTNDSYNNSIHSSCLPCDYVTKLFGILQRVIKSQRVYIYHFDSAKVDTLSLRKVKAAKFSENFKFKFSGLMKKYTKFRPYQCVVFKKEMFLLWVHFLIRANVLTLQTAHRNFLILCQIVSHSNINYLIRQNKASKIDPKMLKQ